jgi:hypothetical protein
MSFKDIKGLKYYLAYTCIAVGAFTYSGMFGYKWLGATKTERERPTGTGPRYHRIYHK